MDPILLGCAGAAAIAGLSAWGSYNRLMALDARCDTAFADVDAQLKHRHSLIPNLVETVRGYAAHERVVLTEVTQARANALRTAGAETRLEAETQVGQSIQSLLSVVERYPEIQASSHFRELRAELTDAENRITAARRFFNLAVNEYNATLRQFPGNLVGAALRLGRREPFDRGIERILLDEPVAVRF